MVFSPSSVVQEESQPFHFGKRRGLKPWRELRQDDFIVADAFVVVGKERRGFRGNDRLLPINASESVDGLKRLPICGDENLRSSRRRANANCGAHETVYLAEFRPNGRFKVL